MGCDAIGRAVKDGAGVLWIKGCDRMAAARTGCIAGANNSGPATTDGGAAVFSSWQGTTTDVTLAALDG
jgi:hypothetical protein